MALKHSRHITDSTRAASAADRGWVNPVQSNSSFEVKDCHSTQLHVQVLNHTFVLCDFVRGKTRGKRSGARRVDLMIEVDLVIVDPGVVDSGSLGRSRVWE